MLSIWSLLVETICFKFRFIFQALNHRSSSTKLELHLWSRTKDIFLNGFRLKTQLMQNVKYTDLWKLLDLLQKNWMIFQKMILVNPNFFLHTIYILFWFIYIVEGANKQAQGNLEVSFPTIFSFLCFYVLSLCLYNHLD